MYKYIIKGKDLQYRNLLQHFDVLQISELSRFKVSHPRLRILQILPSMEIKFTLMFHKVYQLAQAIANSYLLAALA